MHDLELSNDGKKIIHLLKSVMGFIIGGVFCTCLLIYMFCSKLISRLKSILKLPGLYNFRTRDFDASIQPAIIYNETINIGFLPVEVNEAIQIKLPTLLNVKEILIEFELLGSSKSLELVYVIYFKPHKPDYFYLFDSSSLYDSKITDNKVRLWYQYPSDKTLNFICSDIKYNELATDFSVKARIIARR